MDGGSTFLDFSGMPELTSNPITIFPVVAYIAFPLLPYELFLFMPFVFAYFVEKPTDKITITRLVAFITYFGAIWGGLVHYIALGAVLSGVITDSDHSICAALPAPTPGPWCKLLTGHVAFMVPMGTYFLYLVLTERRKYGWFAWASFRQDEATVLHTRCALYFLVAGFSGNLPYFGQLAIQGFGALLGNGIYASTNYLPWYYGRGFFEFGAYTSWQLMGFYFLYKVLPIVRPPSESSPLSFRIVGVGSTSLIRAPVPCQAIRAPRGLTMV